MSSRMRTHRMWILALIASLLVIALIIAMPVESRDRAANAERVPVYGPAERLPDLGGPWSVTMDISARGDVVGVSTSPERGAYAVLWTISHDIVDLGTPGGRASLAFAINSHGQVTGELYQLLNGEATACIWRADEAMVELDGLGGSTSSAHDINDAGTVAGTSCTPRGAYHACIWRSDGEIVDLGTLGGSDSHAHAVNSRGMVVGTSRTPDQTLHVFLWTQEGGMRDLGPLGDEATYPSDINDHGVIAGRSLFDGDLRAWRWSEEGGLELLPDLGGGRGCANGINNLGQIVGWADDASGLMHAVLWDASGQIHTVSQPEEAGAIALAINDSSVVAGQVPTTGSATAAVLWMPVRRP